MTLTDVYCPPIPSWWQAPPSVVVRKWNVPDVEKVAPVKKELTEEERCRRAYHRQYQAANRKKLNDQKREWYLRTGRAKRKAKREEMRKAAVRTMVEAQ